ncbi:hypothetical protein [Blattabacterium cuenoti]|uniref:hypothetical protein n=1 Tax=Blattabacterium cuenoti TaxID=1653831 RepID=UPI00163CF588|nr:hypothetical protein [Blattabacterium cuenoti]
MIYRRIVLIIFLITFSSCFLSKKNIDISDEKKSQLHKAILLNENVKKYYEKSSNDNLDNQLVFYTIEELHQFIKNHPNSIKLKEVLKLLNDLLLKIEIKNYHIAESYFLMHRYKVSLQYFKDFINVFPNSHFKEKVLYKICVAQYKISMKKDFFKSYEKYMKYYSKYSNAKKLKILYKELTKKV